MLCSAVSSTTGKDLASTILTQLSKLWLNLGHIRGQGYDGASNVSGKYRGVQARVKELYPLAMYTHCCNHVLNLVIGTSSQLPVIRNAMASISDICFFLSRSAQRVSIFQDNVEREVSGSASSRHMLKPICATRWVERHDSIIIFVTLLPALVSTLEELQQENKQEEVATSGVPRVSRARGQTQFWRPPTQPVHGSIDAKIELELKVRRKLTRAPAIACI